MGGEKSPVWKTVESSKGVYDRCVVLGNTSEQSGDCSYELLGLLYHRYLVRAAPPLGQVDIGKAGGSKDSGQWP